MANLNNKTQGIIEGLSDFWLLYFKEIDQLKVLYEGTDILIGQSYLDLLSLLLNNSIQDSPLFNKELFKLIQISETDIRFLQRSNPDRSKYVFVSPDNIVTTRALNNKILSVTNALERDIDYDVNETDRTFEFAYDPLNAYIHVTIGTGNCEFMLRTKDPLIRTLSVQLVDTGALPITITRNGVGDLITITYDGPANTGSTRARDIVGTINMHPVFSGLLFAELAISDGGTASPPATGVLPLSRVSVSPLDDFATRVISRDFGGRLTSGSITDWVAAGVEKGDIIRLLSGPTVAIPQELEVALVRKDALYTYPDEQIDFIKPSDKTSFSILREPEDNTSTQEPFSASGVAVQTGINGNITGPTRTFFSPTASFSPVHQGDLLELLGTLNVGYVRISAVIDANTVLLASTSLTSEGSITWNLVTNLSPALILTDGVITQNVDGTTSFSSATAPFTALIEPVGTVIKVSRAGVLELYEVIKKVSTTEVLIDAADAAAGGGLTWGWAQYFPPTTTMAFPFIKKGTVEITARRLVDEQAVTEGRDFIILEDAATIQPITVWRADVGLQVNYDYRTVVVPNTVILQSGVDGTLTYGSPSLFSSPTSNFTYNDIGQALEISNSGLNPSNNGTFYIASIVSPTIVRLSTDRAVSATVETNNGALIWAERQLGSFQTDAISALVRETGFWAPDTMVDRFHLYNTFGYLINRFAQSSEEYRSLIRGVFQLFMLGPTLERFESAVNTVAGLSVVRDNGEILLSYESNALDTGTDGVFDATSKTFSSLSANFVAATTTRYILATSGLNENKLFRINQYVDSNTVILNEIPVSETGVVWELSETGTQQVITSKRTYSFARTIPLRAAIKDTANFGVKIFRAFEVLTDVFNVTDYVETPTWWERVQIPEQLWVGEDGIRRQSTPALFENTIGASDDPHIGDPGFVIGADSTGFVPPSIFQYDDGGLNDGVVTGDVNYPISNNVYFTTTTNALFTPADLGNVLVLGGVNRHRILQVFSSSNVQIESFVNVPNASALSWSVESQPTVLRHKAAFVVLDTWLKHHLFFLSFDPSLLGQLSAELITDLQSLVLIAKPTYTYIILTPSSLFKEIIRIEEDEIEINGSINLGGSAGEVIASNASPLLIIGSSWKIGNWFRYVENSSSFNAPSASVTDVLGVPTAGYAHHITKVAITNDALTSGSRPIPYAGHVERVIASGTGALVDYDGSNWNITLSSAVLGDTLIGAIIRITGGTVNSGANNGDHYIGRLLSNVKATVGTFTNPGVEPGLSWQLVTYGGATGFVSNTPQGETIFSDSSGKHNFDLANVGQYIRYDFTSHISNGLLRIGHVPANNSPVCRIFELVRVFPIQGAADFTGAVSGFDLTATASLFSNEMCRVQRRAMHAPSELKDQYYVVFTSGANNGVRRRIENLVSNTVVTLAGAALVTDAAVTYYVEVERHPLVESETSSWTHLKNFVVINGNTLDLSNTPTQDVASPVLYTAYGVREPIDPALQVFDASQGDTYYSIGMHDPRPKQGRSRSGQDTDLREDPIQITRT